MKSFLLPYRKVTCHMKTVIPNSSPPHWECESQSPEQHYNQTFINYTRHTLLQFTEIYVNTAAKIVSSAVFECRQSDSNEHFLKPSMVEWDLLPSCGQNREAQLSCWGFSLKIGTCCPRVATARIAASWCLIWWDSRVRYSKEEHCILKPDQIVKVEYDVRKMDQNVFKVDPNFHKGDKHIVLMWRFWVQVYISPHQEDSSGPRWCGEREERGWYAPRNIHYSPRFSR